MERCSATGPASVCTVHPRTRTLSFRSRLSAVVTKARSARACDGGGTPSHTQTSIRAQPEHWHALARTGMHSHALACNHVHSHALACNHVQSSHLGLELEGAHRKRDDDLLEPLRVPDEERNQRLSEAPRERFPGYRMRDANKDQSTCNWFAIPVPSESPSEGIRRLACPRAAGMYGQSMGNQRASNEQSTGN